ncbi:MAG: aspartate--tRNA ligase [Acidobacteria bacterium]|nr:aspartate--tRNA ligase [Acidobacteriota bacterium]
MAILLDNLGDLERTHSCGELRAEDAGKTVVLMGWVAVRRDFGPLTFVDLRDREGLMQVVFNEETAPEAHARAKELRGEYVVAVRGEVVPRSEATRNPRLSTGDIEVRARELLVLNEARTPPFQLDAPPDKLASEDVRLKYRYLDLRRPQLQANLRLRARVVSEIHRFMDGEGFTEIETPILIKSTPEGARDYVVPSRLHHGKFYALPQSPQIFKQICMIAGLERYYQIARCFRDEDLRADRQPEFTQLDVEFSFASPEQVYRLIEGLMQRVFRLVGVELPEKFPRLTYAEALRRYGSDKPDLRFGMELQDLSHALEATTFAPFALVFEKGGEVKGLTLKGGAHLSRKSLDELQEFTRRYGAGTYTPLWVTDFPMFEYDEEHERFYAMHHPFTSPLDEDLPLFERAVEGGETALLGNLRAKAYDTVINGIEVAGGSIRIYRQDVQRLVFKALGLSEEKARARFGFFLDALEFGTPPHGGIASGIERLLMALAGIDNIRDVMAFPKTASAADLMIDSPGELDPSQLDELHIRIVED